MNKVTTTKRFIGYYTVTTTTPAGNKHEMTLERFSTTEWELTSEDFSLCCAGWWGKKKDALQWLTMHFDENEQGRHE